MEISMIKRVKLMAGFILIISLFFSGVPDAQAGTRTEKFSRGLTNMITAPFELFRQPGVLQEEHDYNVPMSLVGGLFTSVYAIIARELAGIYEVLSFPIEAPENFRSVIDPPTIFDSYETPRDYKS